MKLLSRNKLNTLIEAVGLVISFTVFIVLMSQVWYDVTFDRSYPGSGRIYLFERPQSRTRNQAPYQSLMNRPQIQAIRDASPEVEAVGTMGESMLVDPSNDTPMEFLAAALVDNDFVNIFSFRMVAGTLNGFDNPESLLLSETSAKTLFGGSGQAVGKHLKLERNGIQEVTVIGVFKDFPVNSLIAGIGAFGQLGDLYAGNNDPNYESFDAFVKLRKGADPKKIAPVLAKAFERNWVLWEDQDTPSDIRERVLNDSRLVTLHSVHYDPFLNGAGSRSRDFILTAIALIFLLVGLLNVLNLTNAELPFRIQGNSVRKIFGADNSQILGKDLMKAAILCLLSFGVALIITIFVSNSPLASFLTVPLRIGTLRPVLICCLLVALAGSLLVTYLPSRYGNSFSPSSVLKGRISLSGKGKEFRTGTLALQFLLSFLFIEVGLMIGIQNNYVSNFDLGFQIKDIAHCWLGFETAAKKETVREELLKDKDIVDITFANQSILMESPILNTRESNGVTARFAGIDVSPNYLDFFSFDIVEGRGFTEEDGEASTGVYVVNEAFMRAYPEIKVGSHMKGIRVACPDTDAEIVGVVKDFNYQDLTHPIEPFAFYCSGEPSQKGDLTPRYFRAEVKTVEGKSGEVAGRLAGILHKIGGTKDARVSLLISSAKKLYSGNAAESALVKTSSIFSLLLALLGIFGLVYLEAQTIRKEVAIRKVMGASTKDLIWMMARKYIVFGTVVFAVSVPLGIWIISRWMEQFSEKAPVPVWIFILAWIIVIGTTVAVISSMALVVSRTNPATELKKE